jgi:hypothetical protein
MASLRLTCLNCWMVSPAGTRYCPNCGEAVDPALVKELQWLYETLRQLDGRIALGQGERTVTELRDELRDKYQSLRQAPAGATAATGIPATSVFGGTPAWPLSIPVAPAPPGPSTPTAPRPPAGPAFSWSAFIADQAIAIMAYLGGFLLLMATLSFEIGGLGLGDTAKLTVVLAVYVLFGALGARLRGMQRLRTVGGAYLGVFALLTPLVALAVYLFALRGLGLAVAGMVCIAAAYATIIYLILARQTTFATYGYLGWVALGVAALAAVAWAAAPAEWWVAALAAAALVMLAARLALPGARALAEPAVIVAALISSAALLGATLLSLLLWGFAGTVTLSRAAITLGTALLVSLALAWDRYLRVRTWQNAVNRQTSIDLMEALAAALAAIAIRDGAQWAGADRATLAGVLAALGLAEGAGALLVRFSQPARQRLRWGLFGLGLVWAAFGVFAVARAPLPNWALVLALGAVATVALAITLAERLPAWLLLCGGAAAPAWAIATSSALAANALPQPDLHAGALILVWSEFAFTVALWGVGMLLGNRTVSRLYGLMLHIVVLANALYVVLLLIFSLPHDPAVQESMLTAFAGMAYLAGVQQRRVELTLAMPFFGLVAVALTPAPTFPPAVAVALGTAVAGAAISRLSQSRWAVAPYALGAGASLFAVARVTPFDSGHIAAWLLFFAAVAYILAALERAPLAGIAPVLYATLAVLAQPDAHILLPLALGLAALGIVIGRVAGPRWVWPPYAAAVVAAVGAAYQAQGDPAFETLALAALALAAYVIAAVEARPDVLPASFIVGLLSLASLAHWQALASWQTTLAFAALAWGYAALAYLWRALPWLGTVRGAWWQTGATAPDARPIGLRLHRWAGLILAAGTALVASLIPEGFAGHQPQTQAAVAALLSLGVMLFWRGRDREPLLAIVGGGRALWYLAGECLALAITWETRWLGADNIQAFVLAPGSYQILIGVLLPVDDALHRPVNLGRTASLLGALLLLTPTLAQSFSSDPNWVYALALALEAVVLVGVGVGTRARLLVLIGSSFVGLAALRGAILAFQSGAVALVIGILAALLMGGATWLSLRSRTQAGNQP